ncbi:MAG: tetratricopeptide repeat protein [Bacteroidota bacterium]
MRKAKRYMLSTGLWCIVLYSSLGLCAANSYASTPQSLLELQHSPSPYECAVLSAHTYQKDLQQGDPVVWIDPKTQQVHALHGWNVYQILTEDNDKLLSQAFQQLGLPYGYRGIIYLNARKKQLVLAHRGTELNNMSAIKTDARSIAQNVIGGQERLVPRLLDQAITIAHQEKCTLAVTGHSLGGWLAQITAFIAKSQYPEAHVKAITFDAPGSKPMLEQINARINPISLEQLDITNYLSAPNLINACNPHIGTVYRVVFEQFNPKRTSYTQQSHTIQALIRAFDPATGDAYQTLSVHSWPEVSKKNLNLAAKIISGDKINAILALCQLAKKCINQEALGEYDGFFKFAKQVNCYHPKPYTKTGKDSFDLAFKYHYNTAPFIPSQLHIRHFPETAQQFLKKLYTGSKAHAKVAAQDQLLQAIVWNQQTGRVHIPYETDLRLVCDQLLSTVLDNPGLNQAAGGLTPLHTTNLLPPLPPPAFSFFVGRAQALKALRQCFQANQEYIIAPPITGPGGIGKTQLALRVVKQQVEEQDYAHVFWIPAESREKLVNAYLRMAEGLGIYVDKKDLQQAVQTVRLHLKDRHCLYVFDDAPDIEVIQDFLPLEQGHVLTTSRNSSVNAWPTKPLLMDPFSEQEALTLAQKLGYGQSKQEQEALQSLLSRVPRYPLTLVQLFSTLEDEDYTLTNFLTDMQHHAAKAQEQALITLLNEQPHARVGYAQSMVYVLKTSLERLAKERQGVEALQLISQLAYLDPKGIPMEWLLTWDREDTSPFRRKTRSALSLLEKYSLIQWDRSAQQVYINAGMQLMVRHLHPQPSLTSLINRLVDYVGDEEDASQNVAQWSSLLSHGRMLFARLATPQYLEEAYVLTKYLTKACSVCCLFKEGVSWAEKRLEIAEQRYAGQDHPEVAQSLNNVGESLWKLGSYQEALAYYKRGLAMRQRLYKDQDHPYIAGSLNNVGYSLGELGNYQEALGYLNQALAMRQRLYKDQDHPYIAGSLNNVGRSLGELGNHQEALAYYKQAFGMERRLYPDQDHPDIASSLNNMGLILRQLGSRQEALIYHKWALEMSRRLYKGHDHPDIAIALDNVGRSLGKLGSYQEALIYHEQALEMRNRFYNNQDHPNIATSLSDVGLSLAYLGNQKESLGYFNRALDMLKRLYQEQDHPSIAHIPNKVGLTFVKSGDYQEGLAYQQKALAMQTRLYKDQDHPRIAKTLHGMGEALEGLGQFTEAVAYYTQALCMALHIYKKEHPHITQYLNNLTKTLSKLNDSVLIQQTKDEVLPLCTQWLGEKHTLTQQLRNTGK